MYVTYRVNTTTPNTFQFSRTSFEEFYTQLTNAITNPVAPPAHTAPRFRTFFVDHLTPEYINILKNQQTQFEQTFSSQLHLYSDANMTQHYTTFRIPKASGGTRTINAPNPTVKTLLSNITQALTAYQILSHNCAYAYVPGRCIKHAIEHHQNTQHKWFMKIDLHDFFGSCNPDFIRTQLNQIPFFRTLDPHLLNALIHLCTLPLSETQVGLPQGSPLSPWLTNQIMLPIDAKLNKLCKTHNITYTRYADDMLFSARTKNCVKHAKTLVEEALQNTPFIINEEKTKISSVYGQNWNLGLMLNKENNITIGHKAKERFRAVLFDFCTRPDSWHYQETTELLGKLQYYISIEPEYFQALLTKYGNKFTMDIRQKMIEIIKTRV